MDESNRSCVKNVEACSLNQSRIWDGGNVCPRILVVGSCASGKSSVIGSVIAEGAKDPGCDINAHSFHELNFASIDSDAGRQFQCSVPQSDALWAIVNVENPISKAEINALLPLLKNAREKLIILTHVDRMSDAEKKSAEELICSHCREHGIELHDSQVYTYYPFCDCKGLVA